MIIFKQFDLRFNSKKFIIENDGLRVISKSLSGRKESVVGFHHIGNLVTRERRRIVWLLMIGLLSVGFGFIIEYGVWQPKGVGENTSIGFVFIGILFILIHFVTAKQYMYLNNASNTMSIQFLDNKPSKEKLEAFCQTLQKEVKSYMLSEYADFDHEIPFGNQQNNLTWLLENKYITGDEFEEKLKELISLFKQDEEKPRHIGFKTGRGK